MRSLVVVLAACALLAGCGPKGAAEKPFVEYVLLFHSDEAAFEASDFWEIRTFGDGGDGELIIMQVNGVPLVGAWNGAIHRGLNAYMLPGKNTIEILGDLSCTAYLHVLRLETDITAASQDTREVLRVIIEPQDGSPGRYVYTFEEEVPFVLDSLLACDVLSPDDREALRASAMPLLLEFDASIRRGDAESVARILSEGMSVWLAKTDTAPDSWLDDVSREWCDMRSVIPEIDWNSAHSIVGPRAMTWYVGISEIGKIHPYVLRFEHDDFVVLPAMALVLVRLDGKWVIWNWNHG